MTLSIEQPGLRSNRQRYPVKILVLVVDDHKEVLKFIEVDLKLRGFDVITGTSGEEALQLVDSARPNIMLLDMLMPGIGGFETLRRLREYSRMPVIAFSASPENQRKALNAGANGFLQKPFYPDELANEIRRILN